jgi:N-acetylglutamate synthase-like GNAT family acetyltransferase
VPRAATFPTGPVGHDAVLLTAVAVLPELAGGGLGRLLVQAMAKDLTRRGVRAIEAFGDSQPTSESHCVIPADFLLSVGFKTVRAHHRWPRLRLELRSGLSWKEDVEAALERLLGEITIPAQNAGRLSGLEVPDRPVRAPIH